MKNTSSENHRKMSSKNSKFVRQMKRLSRSQFIAFSLVFQKFLRNTVSALSNRSDQFYRKKPLGEILLKMNLKLDGDIMVNFEPGEYMRMFLQSVTQAAGKKKVLLIRVKPTTFWLLESRICTNNQNVACVQIPHPPLPPLRKNRRRTRQGKRENRLQTLFPFFALRPRSLALASVLVDFRKKQKTTYVYRLDQQFLVYLTAGFTDLNDSQSLVGYLQVSGPKFYRDLCPPEKRKEWLSNFASKQDYKVYT